ncbi:MAG: hypothetical protein ABSG02_19685 [Terriglobales bacterium]
MLSGRKLALTLVFTGLVAIGAGVSCRGFFQNPTISSIAIQPPTPNVEVGAANAQTLQAWGTYSDGSRSQITSGVSWSSSDTAVIEINQNTGLATGEGSGGSATITAAAQGLSATASATAYLGTIANFELCMGTFAAPTNCSANLTWNATGASSGNPTETFIAEGNSGGTEFDLTTGSTWTVVTQPTQGLISCTNNGASPETCIVNESSTSGTYAVTVTYGTTSATLTIVVTQ